MIADDPKQWSSWRREPVPAEPAAAEVNSAELAIEEYYFWLGHHQAAQAGTERPFGQAQFGEELED